MQIQSTEYHIPNVKILNLLLLVSIWAYYKRLGMAIAKLPKNEVLMFSVILNLRRVKTVTIVIDDLFGNPREIPTQEQTVIIQH